MLTILTDTREQRPYTFRQYSDVKTESATLRTGDYSIAGFQDKITIERKSLTDLFGSCGSGRKRFEAEFKRMAGYDVAGLVIESDFLDVFRTPPKYTKMNPKSVYRTVLAWSVRYGVHVWWGHNREMSEKIVYIVLSGWGKDNVGN